MLSSVKNWSQRVNVFMKIVFVLYGILLILAIVSIISTAVAPVATFAEYDEMHDYLRVWVGDRGNDAINMAHIDDLAARKTAVLIWSVVVLVVVSSISLYLVPVNNIVRETVCGNVFVGKVSRNLKFIFIVSIIMSLIMHNLYQFAGVFYQLILPDYFYGSYVPQGFSVDLGVAIDIVVYTGLYTAFKYGEELQTQADETL